MSLCLLGQPLLRLLERGEDCLLDLLLTLQHLLVRQTADCGRNLPQVAARHVGDTS